MTFDAASADEAKHIATALERDELSRDATQANRGSRAHVISIDPSPPRCFIVVYQSNLSGNDCVESVLLARQAMNHGDHH